MTTYSVDVLKDGTINEVTDDLVSGIYTIKDGKINSFEKIELSVRTKSESFNSFPSFELALKKLVEVEAFNKSTWG